MKNSIPEGDLEFFHDAGENERSGSQRLCAKWGALMANGSAAPRMQKRGGRATVAKCYALMGLHSSLVYIHKPGNTRAKMIIAVNAIHTCLPRGLQATDDMWTVRSKASKEIGLLNFFNLWALREGLPVSLVRDAEMTTKIIFERSSPKRGVGRGLEKRVDRGPILKFYCRPKAQEKQHFGKSHFYVIAFSQEIQ